MTSYVELHARSAFSFLQGASLPEELAGVCSEMDSGAMAVLEIDNVAGAPRFSALRSRPRTGRAGRCWSRTAPVIRICAA